MFRYLSLFLLAVVACPVAFAAPAHEHGVANLDIVIDGHKLLINLESPLHNLVGFEHPPNNDQQRAALQKMDSSLRDGLALFKPSIEAACTLTGVKVDQPFANENENDRAKQPEHQHTRQHADARSAWEFSCARPQALKQLDVLLFDSFSGMHRIKVQMATPNRQSSTVLTKSKRHIDF